MTKKWLNVNPKSTRNVDNSIMEHLNIFMFVGRYLVDGLIAGRSSASKRQRKVIAISY